MTYHEIFERAVGLIGRDNVSDYRPAVYEGRLNGMFNFPQACCVPDAIMIWLKNGDRIIYRVVEPKEG